MSDYSLVAEHPSHFEISHPEKGAFKVAKRSLDAGTIKKIKALPKAMFGGGDPEDETGTATGNETAPVETAPADTLSEAPAEVPVASPGPLTAGNPYAGLLQGAGGSPIAETVGPEAPPDLEASGKYAGLAQATGTATAPETAKAPATNPNTTAGADKEPAKGPATPDATTSAYTKAFDTMEAGIKGAAAAQSAYAKEAEAQQKKMAEDLATQKKTYDTAYTAIDNENKQLTQDVMGAKIDPSRIWANASTGNKVLAGIGILLSGIGSGLTGQPNLAMQVIDKTIDRDIDAQKAELGKKETLLSMNYRKYGNLQAADTATRSQLYAITQGQIGAAAAKMGGDVAAAHAQQAIGELEVKRQQLQHTTAGGQVMKDITTAAYNGQPLTPAQAQAIAPDAWVQMPDGTARVAQTKDGAKKVRAAMGQALELGKLMDGMDRFADQNAGTLGTFTGSSNNTLANGLMAQGMIHIKNLGELGVLSKSDIEDIIEPMMPNPGSYRTGRTKEQTKALREMTQNKLDALYGSELVGYRPGANASKDKRVP